MAYSESFQTIMVDPKFVGYIHSLLSTGVYPSAIHLMAGIYLESQNTEFDDAELGRFILNNKWLFIFFRCSELLTVLELRSVIQNSDNPITPQQAEHRWNLVRNKQEWEMSRGFLGG